MKTLKVILISVAATLLAVLLFWAGRKSVRPVSPSAFLKTDTLWVRDTLTICKPYPVREYITDTVLVACTDTITKNDTTFVVLPMETREYKGEDYEAVVSGYKPVLESISVYPKTAYITNTVKDNRRWAFSVQIGTGMVVPYNDIRKPSVGMYAGVGLTYDIVKF